MPSTRGNMRDSARAKYGEDLPEIMPKLLERLKTPFQIAVDLGVYPNAVRVWLLNNGYRSVNGTWLRETEADHA
jgi:hypothetical protein